MFSMVSGKKSYREGEHLVNPLPEIKNNTFSQVAESNDSAEDL